ncbi:MAG: hypothetical protein LBI28_12610 [Treponema sp.]|jgi:hypothetical protein|nr:hypothetical protein [Treponema sp.]
MMILKAKVPKVLVKGAENTSELECKVCKGWLNHWKKLAGYKQDVKIKCCHPAHERSGEKIADRGAHVMKCPTVKNDNPSKELFIIPVCKEHIIKEKEAIRIPDEMLVDARPCKPRTIGARRR